MFSFFPKNICLAVYQICSKSASLDTWTIAIAAECELIFNLKNDLVSVLSSTLSIIQAQLSSSHRGGYHSNPRFVIVISVVRFILHLIVRQEFLSRMAGLKLSSRPI